MLDPDTVPVRSEGLRLQRQASTGLDVLVNDDGPVAVLNSTAAALWELCDGRTTVREMTLAVRELVGTSGAEADVTLGLDLLLSVGSIRVLPDDQPTAKL
jgi:hypothetical protein